MSKERLIQIIQEILRTETDLSFLLRLQEKELETMVACIRLRVDHIEDQIFQSSWRLLRKSELPFMASIPFLPLSAFEYSLTNPITCTLKMWILALRAAARSCEAPPLFKDISACQTLEGLYDDPFPLGRQGASNMGKVLIHLFFSNSQGLGDLPGVHFFPGQEFDHLLANRLHLVPSPMSRYTPHVPP